MPYIARTSALPELALSGGLIDPRADKQASFDKRMNCRDATDFISNTQLSSLESRHKMVGVSPTTWGGQRRKPDSEYQAKLDKILARSRELGLPRREKNPDQPLSDLVPGLVISGGLSRSPAFDCLAVVSHWTDRTDEVSADDPAATVRLSSTWGTSHIIGEVTTTAYHLGAPCWSLKTHGIEPVEAGSSESDRTAPSAGPHITDVQVVKGCNYGCLRQKTIIEDAHPVASHPCVVIWDDLARLARYKLADAVFCHVYYDAGGGEQMAAIAGLGCVVHDWIDLGADIACGEVSNIIPSLTRGSLEEEPLAEVYSRLTGVMIWYRDNDPYNPAALCLLFTHWWQLANCRHRPVTLLGRTDLGVEAAIAATVPTERPSLEHFRACGTRVERGERPLANTEARLQSILSSDPLPETRAVIDLLVAPVLAYVKGADSLPYEGEYVGAVLAAELAYPHEQKILELWDLAIVMWECGALWAAEIACLCYTHTGKANCDRARDDLTDTTWT
ncbi:hypothetical protein N7449_006595 [Penicillium cf. viridicatum]|uniref:Uncharacterized protein n=1 Tax=Penicillium cf. viridicatum TaxID=2972119 RepID=A0A9W9JHF9_9EURO|nr:hypothetical protein N7449_006595 [Penicillium cf. viridicatum]